MTEEQIKYMVNRFLQWRLPENFNPDAGISFKRDYNEHTSWPMKHEPVGTNLFDVTQTEEMIRYLLEGMPRSESLSVERYLPPGLVPAAHVAVISPPEAQAILADPHATKDDIERAHSMTYEIPCEHGAIPAAECGPTEGMLRGLAERLRKYADSPLPTGKGIEGALVGARANCRIAAREIEEFLAAQPAPNAVVMDARKDGPLNRPVASANPQGSGTSIHKSGYDPDLGMAFDLD